MQLEPLLNRQFRQGRLWTLCAYFVAAEIEVVPPAQGLGEAVPWVNLILIATCL